MAARTSPAIRPSLLSPSLLAPSPTGAQTMPPDRPFRAQLAAGDLVVWCACGRSERQPYCDGSHRGTSLRPVRYTVPQNLTVALCGCKQTKQPPFCDGSHLAYRAGQGEQQG